MYTFGLISMLAFLLGHCTISVQADLEPVDRFIIFEQLNLHQRYIDNDGSLENAQKYVSLYWPEVTFSSNDLGQVTTFHGLDGVKQAYDYDHSVFPLYQWFHSVGAFEIIASGNNSAQVNWRWRVDWKANTTGVVSTGTYNDVFEKRGGIWKCLSRHSTDDLNWPLYLFSAYAALANQTYKPS